ncbi:MAG: hypothetical protein ACLUN0_02510 [Roseburia sp.]
MKRYYAGAVALVFTIGYLGSGWYLAHHVWETDYQIQTDKEVGSLRVAVFCRFPYRDNFSWGRLCRAYENHRGAAPGCGSDCGRLCG